MLDNEPVRIVIRPDSILKPALRHQAALRHVALTDDHLPGIRPRLIGITVEVARHAVHLDNLVDVTRNQTVVIPFLGKDAMQMAAYSMEGATELILNHNTHPLLEIEKVTTPGGTTIKGLNELEHKGFTSSIIQAIKSSATTLIDKEEEDAKNFR